MQSAGSIEPFSSRPELAPRSRHDCHAHDSVAIISGSGSRKDLDASWKGSGKRLHCGAPGSVSAQKARPAAAVDTDVATAQIPPAIPFCAFGQSFPEVQIQAKSVIRSGCKQWQTAGSGSGNIRNRHGKLRTSTQARPSGRESKLAQLGAALEVPHRYQGRSQGYRRRRQGCSRRSPQELGKDARHHRRQEDRSQFTRTRLLARRAACRLPSRQWPAHSNSGWPAQAGRPQFLPHHEKPASAGFLFTPPQRVDSQPCARLNSRCRPAAWRDRAAIRRPRSRQGRCPWRNSSRS